MKIEIEITQEDIDRFWSKTSHSDGCWEWSGTRGRAGYGMYSLHRFSMFAHRFSYLITHQYLPKELMICHTCDNPLCVRPDHLFAGTAKDNADDMVRKGRNHIVRNKFHGPGEHLHHPSIRLTEDQVREIRSLRLTGMTERSLAAQFHISPSHAHRIINRQQRREVD